MIRLVAFLGNPGREYEQTRHNIGQKLSDNVSVLNYSTWQKKFKGLYTHHIINREKIFFLKPETYMNKSGASVLALMQFFKIDKSELLVVHDDIELNFGQLSIRQGGGLAGHNGLRSIVNVLNAKDFYRFRLGISRPERGDVSSHVLGKFNNDEQELLPRYMDKACEALEYCLENSIEAGIKKYPKINLLN